MFLNLENFNVEWLQCKNYNILTRLKICGAIKETTMVVLENNWVDNWLLKILVLLFVAGFSITLFKIIKQLKILTNNIRSKTKDIWIRLLNFVYSLRLKQELEKKDEVIRMEQLKSYLIEQYEVEDSVEILSDSESEKSSSSTEPKAEITNEPNILLKEVNDLEEGEKSSPDEQTIKKVKLPLDLVCLPLQSRPSTDSNISPPVKKPKLESNGTSDGLNKLPSGIFKKSIVNRSDDPLKKLKSNNVFTKSDIPKLDLKTLHIRESNSHQIRAPPSSPVSSLSPRNRKVSDVNVTSVKSGIFDARKRFIEKHKSDISNSGSDRSSISKKSVAIVDGKGNIKYVHKAGIRTLP